MEDYQDESGGVQVCSQTSMLKYGLWLNTSKNPRLKTVDFPQLGISLEVRHVETALSNDIVAPTDFSSNVKSRFHADSNEVCMHVCMLVHKLDL